MEINEKKINQLTDIFIKQLNELVTFMMDFIPEGQDKHSYKRTFSDKWFDMAKETYGHAIYGMKELWYLQEDTLEKKIKQLYYHLHQYDELQKALNDIWEKRNEYLQVIIRQGIIYVYNWSQKGDYIHFEFIDDANWNINTLVVKIHGQYLKIEDIEPLDQSYKLIETFINNTKKENNEDEKN